MDPFLINHRVDSILYDISGGIYPSTIRDQMLRGFILVQRAIDASLIGPDKSLLVVGAGAAGATAAITAAQRNVPTVLVEQKRKPFTAQLGAPTRYVCPTQYDWPCRHWHKAMFPWTSPTMPLDWQAGRAGRIAGIWTSKLHAFQAKLSTLKIYYGREFLQNYNVVPDGKGGEQLEAHFDPMLPNEPLLFNMVISCIGFGSERCTVGSYRGFSFWDIDKFERPDLGLSSGVAANVLISGGGDGALQDLMRTLTNQKSVGDLYKLLPFDVKRDIERIIYNAEDQAQRGYVWGTGDLWPHDHRVHEWLHNRHLDAIGELTSHSSWPQVENALDGVLKNPPNKLKVKLVFPCTHFTQCYGLNRFMVLLLAEFMERKHGLKILQPQTKVMDVVGVGHSCKKPNDCHGEDHEVVFVPANCETFKSAGGDRNQHRAVPGGPYNVVVVRHGTQSPAPLFRQHPIAFRQLLPYYLDY